MNEDSTSTSYVDLTTPSIYFQHKDIRCSACGCSIFSLWIGYYEVHAVCTKCGLDEVIYDG